MPAVLYDPARHEPLRPIPWDEARERAAIACIVADTEKAFRGDRYWLAHPLDRVGGAAELADTPLYFGACGVIWALQYLGAVGAATLTRRYDGDFDTLLVRHRSWLGADAENERASYLMGDL